MKTEIHWDNIIYMIILVWYVYKTHIGPYYNYYVCYTRHQFKQVCLYWKELWGIMLLKSLYFRIWQSRPEDFCYALHRGLRDLLG